MLIRMSHFNIQYGNEFQENDFRSTSALLQIKDLFA